MTVVHLGNLDFEATSGGQGQVVMVMVMVMGGGVTEAPPLRGPSHGGGGLPRPKFFYGKRVIVGIWMASLIENKV